MKKFDLMNLFKFIFDNGLIILFSFILIPMILVLIILKFVFDETPMFFKQSRIGFMGTPFIIYKFCTMKDLKDKHGNFLEDKDRLTKLGKFMRKYSLDEFPGLWNVLRGDMSLIGPRPFISEYLTLYTKDQMVRHHVKPGITGWAQINGRNSLTWEEKFELDIWYVKNQSIWLDIKIIFKTFLKVLKREGISHEKSSTMPKFRGTKT